MIFYIFVNIINICKSYLLMKNIKYFVFFVIITGCLQSGVERVRIVDRNGNPARINKIVPKFNEEQLLKQREAFNSNQETNFEINKFRQDYNTTTAQPINRNLPPAAATSDQNIIVPINNRYPNDIFADRITNYNYIQDNITTVQGTRKADDPKTVTRQEIIEDTNNKIIEGDIVDTRTGEKIKQKITSTSRTVKQQPSTKVQPKTANNKSTAKATAAKNASSQRQYYIQIGVYSKKKNADIAYNKYSKISSGSIEEYNVKNKKKYKVLLGPYNNKKVAEQNLEKVIKTGHYDVYITEKK